MFTTVFSLSIVTKVSAATFTPRLTAPSYDNKYYYNGNYNIFYSAGYGMPNCTCYAYGRAYEILGYEPDLSWGSAYMWYDYNRTYGYYDYGQTPRVGAICCWSYGSGGHVAVVEKIDSDGLMTISNSAYGSTNFYLTYAYTWDSNPGGNSYWNFQGYIYLLDEDEVIEPVTTKPVATTKPTQPASQASDYETGYYTVDAQPYLNMRSGAGTNSNIIKAVPDNTVLNVTKTVYSGGIDWGYTTYKNTNGWVALGFCEYEGKTQPTTAAPTTVPATTVAPTTKATVPANTVAPTTKAKSTIPAPTAAPVVPTVPLSHGGRGDVNGDGLISILDATLIQQYLAGLLDLSKTDVQWADFNCDGLVNIDDATALQRML
ncbi:MAG: CHAP domain-containing protein, partial [Ruminococcus sp.]|nr:CHAP domain-containing protein [Ruminococcus sp.]